ALTLTGSAVGLRTRGSPVTDWTADQAPPAPVTTFDIGSRLCVDRPRVTTTANWLSVSVGRRQTVRRRSRSPLHSSAYQPAADRATIMKLTPKNSTARVITYRSTRL